MGGMEIVKQHLEYAVDLHGRGLQKGWVHHSIDIDPVCQRVLIGHGGSHVFKDLLQVLQLGARLAVTRVMSRAEAHVKTLSEASQKASSKAEKQAAKDELTRFGEDLLKQLMDCMDQHETEDLFNDTAPCAKHAGDGFSKCNIFPDKTMVNTDDKEYWMAGTSCTDWSTMGTQCALAGATVLPFAIQLQMVKRRRPRVFFHECTRCFKPKILKMYLPGFLASCVCNSVNAITVILLILNMDSLTLTLTLTQSIE